jgi:hypothetical protein
VGDPAGQLSHGFHLLGLPQRLLVAPELLSAFEDLLFQRGVQLDERLLGALAFRDLTLRRLRKTDIVDCNRRFGRKPRKAPFRALRKDAGLAVAKE